MATTLSGVTQSQVGPQYDLAVGFDPGTGTATMVGYVLATSQPWTETTDITDSDRIVQISSPLSTDRYAYFPKVSQGDWSGGERQVFFVDPAHYYSSSKLETGIPGHLRIAGKYQSPSWPSNIGSVTQGSGSVALDPNGLNYYVAGRSGTSGNIAAISTASPGTASAARVGPSATVNVVEEIMVGPDVLYIAIDGGTNPGIYSGVSNTRVGTDATSSSYNNRVMAYFNPGGAPSLFYVLSGAAPNSTLRAYVVNTGVASTVYTSLSPETMLTIVGAGPVSLYFVAGGQLQPGGGGPLPPFSIYKFDGLNATYIGVVLGYPIDLRLVNGVVYLLVAAVSSGFTAMPLIYTIQDTQIALLDDYRYVDPAFQPSGGTSELGCLAGDGNYLYLAWPGLSLKRYNTATGAISDIGHPTVLSHAAAFHGVAAGPQGSVIEAADTSNTLGTLVWGTTTANNDTGNLVTSYFDMGTPTVTKLFRSFEIELNAALGTGASVAVTYQLDNQSAFPGSLTMQTNANTNNLIGYFPASTKGSRVQIKLTLTASNTGVSPDIRSYSLKATLGRAWKLTVQCRRDLRLHDGSIDAQGKLAKDLLANVQNVYRQAAGNCILFLPDATSASGTSQVNAVLEDYSLSTVIPGPAFSERGASDMEGDLTLTLVEAL